MDAVNVLSINENLSTSGQISHSDIQRLAEQGCNTIVNLALSSSDNALVNEGDLVTELGMTYVHIPVQWEAPALDQYYLFETLLEYELQAGRKVWVHCALNMRVSAFVYAFNIRKMGLTEPGAKAHLLSVWQPNEVWSQFLSRLL